MPPPSLCGTRPLRPFGLFSFKNWYLFVILSFSDSLNSTFSIFSLMISILCLASILVCTNISPDFECTCPNIIQCSTAGSFYLKDQELEFYHHFWLSTIFCLVIARLCSMLPPPIPEYMPLTFSILSFLSKVAQFTFLLRFSRFVVLLFVSFTYCCSFPCSPPFRGFESCTDFQRSHLHWVSSQHIILKFQFVIFPSCFWNEGPCSAETVLYMAFITTAALLVLFVNSFAFHVILHPFYYLWLWDGFQYAPCRFYLHWTPAFDPRYAVV